MRAPILLMSFLHLALGTQLAAADCGVVLPGEEARLAAIVKNVAPDLNFYLERCLSQPEAERYCREKGQRLPTIRELALYSQSPGADGISETPKDGYQHVQVSDADEVDEFYYSPRGNRPPDKVLGYFSFWSSSHHRFAASNIWILLGWGGSLFPGIKDARSNLKAVLCVQTSASSPPPPAVRDPIQLFTGSFKGTGHYHYSATKNSSSTPVKLEIVSNGTVLKPISGVSNWPALTAYRIDFSVMTAINYSDGEWTWAGGTSRFAVEDGKIYQACLDSDGVNHWVQSGTISDRSLDFFQVLEWDCKKKATTIHLERIADHSFKVAIDGAFDRPGLKAGGTVGF